MRTIKILFDEKQIAEIDEALKSLGLKRRTDYFRHLHSQYWEDYSERKKSAELRDREFKKLFGGRSNG